MSNDYRVDILFKFPITVNLLIKTAKGSLNQRRPCSFIWHWLCNTTTIVNEIFQIYPPLIRLVGQNEYNIFYKQRHYLLMENILKLFEFWNCLTILRLFESYEIVWKLWNCLKTMKLFENYEIVWNFLKINK